MSSSSPRSWQEAACTLPTASRCRYSRKIRPKADALSSCRAPELGLVPRLHVPRFEGRSHLSREVALGLEPAAQADRARCLLAVVEPTGAIRETGFPRIEIDIVPAQVGDVVEATGVHDRAAREVTEGRLPRSSLGLLLRDHRPVLPFSRTDDQWAS